MKDKKIKTDFENEKELLKDIIMFNHLVSEKRVLHAYRSLQLENNIKDNEETQKAYIKETSELGSMLDLHKSNMELKYNIKIETESIYYGILPELFLKYDLKYFLDENIKSKYSKIKEQIREQIKI